MCGIAAIFSWKNATALKRVKAMTELIRHRGPDDEGYSLFSLTSDIKPLLYAGKDTPGEVYNTKLPYLPSKNISDSFSTENFHLAFGHRRLSIIDLSASGHQPMCDGYERYWITYNGEVYNHIELKQDLELLGHRFRTHTDTEVILHAYMEWGASCLSRFNGMFAFLIYDSLEKTLFGARDRFGVKPLYYWKSPSGYIAFASEIKQFTTLPGWEAKVNGMAAYDFLNWGIANHEPETCFKDVFSLLGGHYFLAKLSVGEPLNIKPERWYQLPFGSYQGSLEDAGRMFASLLEDAVRIRCRADVPIGSCLSGGLDSSSIVCLAHKILQEQGVTHPQMTFSACSRHRQFDESEYMRHVIDRTQVTPFFCYPDLDDLLEKLDVIAWHQDEPFGSTSIFAQWEVFHLVKQNQVKVMLDGQGADEQLAGYQGFLSKRLVDLARGLNFSLLLSEMKMCRELHAISFPSLLLADQLLPGWIKHPIRRALKKNTTAPYWMDIDLLNIKPRDPHQETISHKSSVQAACFSQMTRTSLPMLLRFEDRDSMAHSIEARTPFLDYRLADFIQSLPPEYKLANGITKRVLREGLKDVLPEKIRTRISKLGFATPEEVWVKRDNPSIFRELVRDSVKSSQGILKENAINEADLIIDGKVPFSFVLWRIVSFGRWMQRFNVSL